MTTDLLTTTEAAALLGVNVRAVQYAIKQGRLAAQKYGRDWMIERGEVERYAREHKHNPRELGGESL